MEVIEGPEEKFLEEKFWISLRRNFEILWDGWKNKKLEKRV